MLPEKIAFLDVETTGLSPIRNRIIEIGIIRVEYGIVVSKYQTLINPQMYVSPFIEEVTGIRKEELDLAPLFEDVQRTITEKIEGCYLAAHNARFDYAFLKNEFRRLELPFSQKHFCTVKLSKYLFPRHRRHSLDDIIQRFDITCTNRHRALDDTQVLWDFYQRIQQQFGPEVLEQAFAKVMKKPSVPVGIKNEVIDALPQSPGVYLFYGDNGIPLYVGKSKNIKDRVLSHFSQDHASGSEMSISRQIKSIETIATCGELGALIKESQLIKQLLPIYNKVLRQKKNLIVLRKITKSGYDSVKIETVEKITAEEIPNIYGIFKSKKQAKDFLMNIAEEHGLCKKLLGVDTTNSACFGYRLGACKGACQEKELPLRYNMRFLLAFSNSKIKKWPFESSISLSEEDEQGKDVFVVDKWCLLKVIHYNHHTEKITEFEPLFDVDTYKILNRYLFATKRLVVNEIKPIAKMRKKSLVQEFFQVERSSMEAA